MPLPAIDFELFSAAGFDWQEPSEKYPLGRWVAPPGADKPGIAAVGSAKYLEHESTEVLTCSYDLCDGRGIRRWRPGQPLPQDLFDHVMRPDAELEAHSAEFEAGVVALCVRKYGWPAFPDTVWRCSKAAAHVAQYPGALADLAAVLNGEQQKDPEGRRLILKFCVPQQPIVGLVDKKTGRVKRPDQPARRIYPEDDPEDFERLCAYCDQDVRAEQGAMEHVPPMAPGEVRAWQRNQQMNRRGLGVDREGLRACINILGQVLSRYGDECRQLTGWNITQLEKLKGWLSAYGVHAPSLDADAIEALLARDDLPAPARRLIELRALTGSASVKKTLAMENECCADNRLRNLMIHHGTRPGRPTGAGPQPLNLPKAGPKLVWCECGRPHKLAPLCSWCGAIMRPDARKSWQSDMVDHVLEVMKLGSLDLVERFFGDAMTAIQGCVRGLFVAAPGHDLVSTDYSSLQAVVAACIAGEQWRIDAFLNNEPLYLLGASKITGTSVEQYLAYWEQSSDNPALREHHPDRQKIGKVSELACLAPETEVLTDRGYVAIVDVSTADKLWDGEEWVTHLGLIDRGERSVVSLDGARMTPDHLVDLNGSWKAAGQLASSRNMLRLSLASASASLPWSNKRARKRSGSDAPALWTSTTSAGPTYDVGIRRDAARALGAKPDRLAKTIGRMRTLCRMTRIAAGYLTEYPRASLAASLTAMPTMGGVGFEFTRNGETGRRGVENFSRSSSLSLDGTIRRWSLIEFARMAITLRETFGSLRKATIKRLAERCKICKPSSISTSAVYDLAHAGPRNRFMIRTNSGHLIVHNCGFGGWINSYRAFGSEEPDEVIRKQILGWRDASPAIVECWGGQWRGPPWRRERHELYGFEGCFIAAVQNPGTPYAYRGIQFCMEDGEDCLTIRLYADATGWRRPLRYHQPRLQVSDRNPDELSITFMTWNTNVNYGRRGWVRMNTYGGRLFENAVTGVEVDIQRDGEQRLLEHGYPLVLAVYDEDVGEIPHGKPLTLGLPPVEGLDPYVQEVEHLLSIPAPFAYLPDGTPWPIRASGGWRGRRYRKG